MAALALGGPGTQCFQLSDRLGSRWTQQRIELVQPTQGLRDPQQVLERDAPGTLESLQRGDGNASLRRERALLEASGQPQSAHPAGDALPDFDGCQKLEGCGHCTSIMTL